MSFNSEKRKPKYQTLENGYIIPGGFKAENFQDSLTYVPEYDDVFICTYPKCGTTWTQCILHLLLNKGEPRNLGVDNKICSFIPHLEDDGKDAVLALPRPRVIKTHLPYDMLPKSKDAKYIYVLRNPKDCCVSYYYHTKGFHRCYDWVDGKFEDFFDLFLAGEVDYEDYFDHMLSYLPHLRDRNWLFLLYEEMKLDIRNCVQKIGQFLGGPFLQSSEDPAILEKVIENSGFKTMKTTPSLWSSQQVEGSPGFIRRGEVGDWRKHFTEEQAKKIDQKFKKKFAGTEAEHFWDNFDY